MSDTPAPAAQQARSPRRRVAPWIALAIAVVIGALFVVLAGAEPRDGEAASSSYLIGKPAPAVVSTTIDDEPFDLGRRKGSWVVLNFFDSDCVPCRQEHPELVRFAALQQQLGAELYSIINNDSDENVRAFFAEHGGDWPAVRDDDGKIFVSFGMAQIPETWIIDPNGTVVRRIVGVTTANGLAAIIAEEDARLSVAS